MRKRQMPPVVTFSKTFADADLEERNFWHSRTPQERLWHLEYLRELNYGPEASAARLPQLPRVSQRRRS